LRTSNYNERTRWPKLLDAGSPGSSALFQVELLRSSSSCGFLSSAKQKGHTLSREKENGRLERSKATNSLLA